MKKAKQKKYFLIIGIALMLASCVPQAKLKYVQDDTTTQLKEEYLRIRPEKRIKPFDNIYINVLSMDEQTARIFSNQSSNTSGNINLDLLSYTVSEDEICQ